MTLFSNQLRSTFQNLLVDMSDSLDDFVVHPEKHFTRNGKQAFIKYMLFLCTMNGGTYTKLSYYFHDKKADYLSASAICQARQKIKASAFEHIVYAFNQRVPLTNNYHGYNLLAVDGSAIPIYRNPHSNDDSYIRKSTSHRGFNSLHLNGVYDLCNHVYVDSIIQPRSKLNEHDALNQIVSRSQSPNNNVYICDRGYESYNCIAHLIENNSHFIIRGKDISSNGIASKIGCPFTSGSFDYFVDRILTKKSGQFYKSNPLKYKVLNTGIKFDFISSEKPCYNMSFRIVRVKLDEDHYELLLTNLDSKQFPPSKLKEIYNLRWGIETAFRKLKYTVGMLSFNSKKLELIKQEIYAALFIYNFSSLVSHNTSIKKKDRKYSYFINFSISVTICLDLLKSLAYIRPPDNVEATLTRNLLPIRHERSFKRYPTRRRAWTCFNYKVA